MRQMRQNVIKANSDHAATKKQAFLTALAQAPYGRHGVPVAASAAGVARQTPYRWRSTDPAFAAAWAEVDDRRLEVRLAAVRLELARREREREARLEELRPIWAANAARARAAKDRYRW